MYLRDHFTFYYLSSDPINWHIAGRYQIVDAIHLFHLIFRNATLSRLVSQDLLAMNILVCPMKFWNDQVYLQVFLDQPQKKARHWLQQLVKFRYLIICFIVSLSNSHLITQWTALRLVRIFYARYVTYFTPHVNQ